MSRNLPCWRGLLVVAISDGCLETSLVGGDHEAGSGTCLRCEPKSNMIFSSIFGQTHESSPAHRLIVFDRLLAVFDL